MPTRSDHPPSRVYDKGPRHETPARGYDRGAFRGELEKLLLDDEWRRWLNALGNFSQRDLDAEPEEAESEDRDELPR